MHISIPVANTMEYITNTQVSPFLSKVMIKVCYVGDNRNGTSFSKDLLREMGRNVPGSPIVGYYNKENKDFEEHNRELELHDDGTYEIIDTTKAYGFVPTDAKVWFQKFKDDGVEHEYLCTEGWLWTKVYEEAQRVITHGNNQSMELNRETSKGTWANRENQHKRIFIYSEALIEKLCVLGETYEPCFEGAQIKEQFALHKDELQAIKHDLYAMMDQLKEALEEGGTKVFTTYALEIGDTLWNSLRESLGDEYSIRGAYEEEGQKFAVVQKSEEDTLYRMNFSVDEESFTYSDMSEITMDAEQLTFSFEDGMFKKEEEDEDKKEQSDDNNSDDNTEGEDEKEDEKKKYNLEEVTEYAELKAQYDELEGKFNALQESANQMTEELTSLREFKLEADRKEKQAMIDKFFMLSDEDKQDCVDNIDTYSLSDIEAKLSVICVRNKVSFSAEGENGQGEGANMFGLNNDEGNGDDGAPAWVKAVRQTQKNKEEI